MSSSRAFAGPILKEVGRGSGDKPQARGGGGWERVGSKKDGINDSGHCKSQTITGRDGNQVRATLVNYWKVMGRSSKRSYNEGLSIDCRGKRTKLFFIACGYHRGLRGGQGMNVVGMGYLGKISAIGNLLHCLVRTPLGYP